MKLQGSHLFSIPPTELWLLLTDPAILTAVLPGCQTLTPIAENQYQGELTIKFGPMAGTYTGNLSLSHLIENEGYSFTFTAQSKTSTLGGNGRLQLQPQDNNTRLTYEGEAKVGGQLASHATPLLETTARSVIRQSLENLDRYTQQSEEPQPQLVEFQAAPTDSSNNILDRQQIILLIIAALSAVILFALFYFFNRKQNKES